LAKRIVAAVREDADPPVERWVVGLSPRSLVEARYRVSLEAQSELDQDLRRRFTVVGRQLALTIIRAERDLQYQGRSQ
jgi:hypothetical protein